MTRRRDPRPHRPSAGEAHLCGEADEPTLRLRHPADVLGAIPYIVGYHPSDSVVVMALDGTRLIFTARDDLPGPDAPRTLVTSLVERLTQSVLGLGPTGVLLVGYGCHERARPVLVGLRDGFERAGLHVREVLRADGGRHWSYLCHDLECCPAEGTPYDPSTSSAAAQATFAGRVVLADREAFEAQIKPVGGVARISMGQATVRADDRLTALLARADDEAAAMDALERAGRDAIDAALVRQRSGGRLDDDEMAWLTILLTSLPVRDIAWAHITGTPEELEHQRSLWMDATRRVEPDLVMAPGSLFAFASWRCGETSLARLALERVLDEAPTYNMAAMIAQSLARGLPPSALGDWPGPGMSPHDLNWRRLTGGLTGRPERRRRRRSSWRRAGNRPG